MIKLFCSDYSPDEKQTRGAAAGLDAMGLSLNSSMSEVKDLTATKKKAHFKAFHLATEAADLDCVVISVLLLISLHR